MVTQLADLAGVLREADPADRAEIYAELGLALAYDHTQKLLVAHAGPRQACSEVGVRGATRTKTQRPTSLDGTVRLLSA
jgi:site-specific DNA recombinase